MKRSWTKPINDLLETLTCRVRVLSMLHLQLGWCNELGDVVATTRRLIKAGLLEGDIWNVQLSPISDQPLLAWYPGQSEPDLGLVAELVASRWDDPKHLVPVVGATRLAARIFGSQGGGLPPVHHQNHDLLLSEVFIRYRIQQPDIAASWCGEDGMEMAQRGVKNPDAIICDNNSEHDHVVESAGRYSLQQLEAFHRHCQTDKVSYELW